MDIKQIQKDFLYALQSYNYAFQSYNKESHQTALDQFNKIIAEIDIHKETEQLKDILYKSQYYKERCNNLIENSSRKSEFQITFEEKRKLYFRETPYKELISNLEDIIYKIEKIDSDEIDKELNTVKHKIQYYIGRCYNALNSFEEAKNILIKSIILSSKNKNEKPSLENGRLLYKTPLAYAYKKIGNIQEAIKLWDEIINAKEDLTDDDDEHFYRGKGGAYFDNGSYEKAIREYLKVIDACTTKINKRSYNTVYGNPEDTKIAMFQAYHMLGKCFEELRQYTEAIKYYELSVKEYPNDINDINDINVRSLFRIAKIQCKHVNPEDYQNAINNFSKVIKAVANHKEALYYKAFSHFSIKEFKQSKIDLNTLYKENPNHHDIERLHQKIAENQKEKQEEEIKIKQEEIEQFNFSIKNVKEIYRNAFFILLCYSLICIGFLDGFILDRINSFEWLNENPYLICIIYFSAKLPFIIGLILFYEFMNFIKKHNMKVQISHDMREIKNYIESNIDNTSCPENKKSFIKILYNHSEKTNTERVEEIFQNKKKDKQISENKYLNISELIGNFKEVVECIEKVVKKDDKSKSD